MAILSKARNRVLQRSTADPANDANEQSFVSNVSSDSVGVLEDLKPLDERTKARLRSVVYKLTRDCVRWYKDDMDALAQMSEADLERCVLDFLSKRGWYQAAQEVKKPVQRNTPGGQRRVHGSPGPIPEVGIAGAIPVPRDPGSPVGD